MITEIKMEGNMENTENTIEFTRILQIIKKNLWLLILLPIFLLLSVVLTFLYLSLNTKLQRKY